MIHLTQRVFYYICSAGVKKCILSVTCLRLYNIEIIPICALSYYYAMLLSGNGITSDWWSYDKINMARKPVKKRFKSDQIYMQKYAIWAETNEKSILRFLFSELWWKFIENWPYFEHKNDHNSKNKNRKNHISDFNFPSYGENSSKIDNFE